MWRVNIACMGVEDLLGRAAFAVPATTVPAGLVALRMLCPFTLPHFL